jgi:hypothetical protein
LRILRPLPRSVTRPLSLAILALWVITMIVLVQRSYLQASAANLATDLARYGPTAVWRGVYYRGEKIGFTVSQTTRTDAGFTLEEDGRLQMTLFGAVSPATIHTRALVDRDFLLQSFQFSLDPGTGAIEVRGDVAAVAGASADEPRDGSRPGRARYRLALAITSAGTTRTDVRDLADRPALSLNLSRLLAEGKLVPGSHHQFTVLDPATLANAPVVVDVGRRSIVRAGDTLVPAFRVDVNYQGLQTTSWVTDTGEVMREESPLGLMTVRETPERAQGLAVSGRVQADLLKAAAIVPVMPQHIDEARDVRRLRLRLEGVDLAGFELDGVGQRADGNEIELRDRSADVRPKPGVTSSVKAAFTPGTAKDLAARQRTAGAAFSRADLDAAPLIESDAPAIQAETMKALAGITGARAQAERLVRYVNALIDKKPTVSIPSALEVLRTKVGDCNEHTALYVAMARAAGIPARVAVGLVYVHGAFYYHAWPEVFVDDAWLAVDPTLNEFPADATHLRLLRGGLDKQAAILPLIGKLKISVVDVELAPQAERILVGSNNPPDSAGRSDLASLAAVAGARTAKTCWCGWFGGAK